MAVLKQHPSVDPDRVYLLGISLGGVFAPVLARETQIRGIVVYGTLDRAPSPYPGRSERFFEEIAAVDVRAAWSAVDSLVLALRGEFDDRTLEEAHARIAAIVAARHPGGASHRELPGLDHCWTRHRTMDESRGNCGNGEPVPTLADTVLEFLAAGQGPDRT